MPDLIPFGLSRSSDEQIIGGVASGLASRMGVDVLIVRLALVVLATAAGAGVVLYVGFRVWLPLMTEEERRASPSAIVGPPPTLRRALGVTCITLGVLLLLREAGAWWSDSVTWPVAMAAVGSGLVWTQASDGERDRWEHAVRRAVGERRLPRVGGFGPLRWAIGGSLVAAGVVTFVLGSSLIGEGAGALVDVAIASVVTLVGVGLVIGPWLQGLGRQVTRERTERIRSEERADMAAHLHDSVLQTLALIQRADNPEDVRRLARRQERELRGWLFGRGPDALPARLGEAIRDVAGRVEDTWGTPVEVVLAGDVALTPALSALIDAAGEAMTNAAKHSGAPRVDVFVEVEVAAGDGTGPGLVSVFIRDEGSGFDADGVADDRRGLSHSVVGRMDRHGGKAIITTAPGEGTEVELVYPLPDDDHPSDLGHPPDPGDGHRVDGPRLDGHLVDGPLADGHDPLQEDPIT